MTRSIASLFISFRRCGDHHGVWCPGSEEASKADQFRNGVPRAATVTMSVPGSAGSGQALTVESQSQALLGDTAEWYTTTTRSDHGSQWGALRWADWST